MPWGDRTGPMGFGPMTGRGTGYCASYPVPGYANPWVPRWRRGRGRGFGGRVWGFSGWGRGRGLDTVPTLAIPLFDTLQS